MSSYKVLWFDDEHETLENIKENCLLNDIQLVGYTNAMEGVKALNEQRFDAVLLDGMFFNNPEQSGDTNDSAFGEVAIALENLKSKGTIIPWFVYSGQKNFVKDRASMVELFITRAYANGRVFDKNNDKDFEVLCEVIKNEADKQPLTKVRLNNPEIIKIFEMGYLPESVEYNLLQLLVQPLPKNNNQLKGILSNIRSVHESIFLKLEIIDVLSKNLGSFRNKIIHLSGNASQKTNWKTVSTVYQTKEIRNLNEWIYHTCGTYIHYLEEQHNDGYMISNYAVESLRQGLLEILLWFRKTYEENV